MLPSTLQKERPSHFFLVELLEETDDLHLVVLRYMTAFGSIIVDIQDLYWLETCAIPQRQSIEQLFTNALSQGRLYCSSLVYVEGV